MHPAGTHDFNGDLPVAENEIQREIRPQKVVNDALGKGALQLRKFPNFSRAPEKSGLTIGQFNVQDSG